MHCKPWEAFRLVFPAQHCTARNALLRLALPGIHVPLEGKATPEPCVLQLKCYSQQLLLHCSSAEELWALAMLPWPLPAHTLHL